MATRISGRLKLSVTYRDAGHYTGSITHNGRQLYKATLNPPASGFGRGVSYDSPEAYDSVARSLLSFGINETEDVAQLAEYDTNGNPVVVRGEAAVGRPAKTKGKTKRNGRIEVIRARPRVPHAGRAVLVWFHQYPDKVFQGVVSRASSDSMLVQGVKVAMDPNGQMYNSPKRSVADAFEWRTLQPPHDVQMWNSHHIDRWDYIAKGNGRIEVIRARPRVPHAGRAVLVWFHQYPDKVFQGVVSRASSDSMLVQGVKVAMDPNGQMYNSPKRSVADAFEWRTLQPPHDVQMWNSHHIDRWDYIAKGNGRASNGHHGADGNDAEAAELVASMMNDEAGWRRMSEHAAALKSGDARRRYVIGRVNAGVRQYARQYGSGEGSFGEATRAKAVDQILYQLGR